MASRPLTSTRGAHPLQTVLHEPFKEAHRIPSNLLSIDPRGHCAVASTSVCVSAAACSPLPPLRLPVGAVKLAEICVERLVPIFLDAEKPRPGLSELLPRATYLHTNTSFPSVHTHVRSPVVPLRPRLTRRQHTDLLQAIPQMLRDLKNIRFVTTTLGEQGALLVTRYAVPSVRCTLC